MHKPDAAVRLLPLSRSQRAHYAGLGALAIHASGCEVLLGLGPRESEFVVACGDQAPAALTARERA